jgi:hypothetical protein
MRRPRIVQVASVATTLCVLLCSGTALADKVAVLPFLSSSAATRAELDAAGAATKAAVTSRSHTLPTDSEMITAQMSSKDGVIDTGEEYRAAGRASTSDWTIVGHVDGHGATYRLELEVCQIASGRIESLAREITPAAATTQISEMLAFLVRPEGLNNAAIPWERDQLAPPKPPTPEPTPTPTPTPPPPPPAPEAPPVRHAYAEGHPFALGVYSSVLGAFARPADATGSGTAALVGVTAGYALAGVPGLELRIDFDWSVAGPKSINFDGGVRYAIPLVPSLRIYVGPEAYVGGFFANGADKTPRALLQAAGFASIGVGEHVQLELVGNLAGAAGSPSLGLAGGTLRALVRF